MAMAAARALASSLFAMLLVSLEGKDGRRASRFGRNVHRPCGGTGRYDGFGSSLPAAPGGRRAGSPSKRSEEHTSELQSLMRLSYAVLCLKTKKITNI